MDWHLLVLRMKQSYRSHITLNSVHIKTKMQPVIFIHDISAYLLIYLKKNWKKYILYHFFFSLDGIPVNSGKISGLIRLFQEDHSWVYFIWCFSHRLELSLKDTLKEFLTPVDKWLHHHFYFYQKSSKKLREPKQTKTKASAKALWLLSFKAIHQGILWQSCEKYGEMF